MTCLIQLANPYTGYSEETTCSTIEAARRELHRFACEQDLPLDYVDWSLILPATPTATLIANIWPPVEDAA